MPTESASSSPEASEPAPTPEPWEAKTDDGAVAFVRHWFDLLNVARLEGETEPLLGVSTKDCATCNNVAELAQRLHQPGGIYDSKPWQILQISSPTKYDPPAWQVAVRVLQPAARVKLPDEKKVHETARGRKTLAATFFWRGDQWKMHEVAPVE
ncbi:DUF6318 family protein [Nocardioides gansuensis]|nr:DUF6318 family protein [Nocardioides gansuensis]